MDASTAGTGQRGHHVASQARQQEPFCVVGLAVPSHADAGSYDAAVMVPARQFRESADQCTRTDGPVPPPNYASNVVDLLATGRLLGSRRDRLLPPGIPVFVQKFSGLAYSDKDKYTKKISYSNTILTIQQAACFSMLRRGYSTPSAIFGFSGRNEYIRQKSTMSIPSLLLSINIKKARFPKLPSLRLLKKLIKTRTCLRHRYTHIF